MQQGK
ncbi:hypothetical protein VCHC55A1_3195, partial [Vibrio cholerae HC-55A1]